MIRNRPRRGAYVVAAAALATVGIALPSSASPPPGDPDEFSAIPLSPVSTITGAKSITGRLAQTDPSLIGRTDSTPVNVVVKLDYDAAASYTGDIQGLPATSPAVTGVPLTGETSAEVVYEGYTEQVDSEFRQDLAASIPSADAGQSLQTVYGGVAVTVPANQVDELLALPEVAAVQVDELRQLDTDSSTDFIGAPTIWDQVGGQALAGAGVLFGDLDSGVWPEHPSFADNPALGNPAPTAFPRECNFGDNPLTADLDDPFVCNNKLIGGQPFIDTYNLVYDDEIYPDSARDSNGHGTHTTTTAAGGVVESAKIFGTERGPISGVAPGALVMAYKVCGPLGCFSSDSAAAVEQAILDGVDVINYSISGGEDPYTDVVELAFLGAYEAGILVAASAGNVGVAGAVSHRSPWVLTVAASTQTREFQSTLTLTDGSNVASFVGASITADVGELPVVLAKDIPGYDELCSTPLKSGTFAQGSIIACKRGGIGRVQKGYNVVQGGAAGMILYNLPLQDIETDNHFLPTVHLADGTDFLAFMEEAPGVVTGSFTAGVKAGGQGDVMAAFSSRGPGGQFLKPDVTAPGVQILAGHTPTPTEIAGGPAGEYFQAIAGTSMSSPHAAGAAILLKNLHPSWSPGAIKSALMTTSTTDVVKADTVTPADPFDFGAGRIDLTVAGDAQIVFDETATRMFDLGDDAVTALDLNLASINVPTMPGTVTVTRTATNVGDTTFFFSVSSDELDDTSIKVKPSRGRIRPGQSKTFEITIASSLPTGQYFSEITFDSRNSPDLHLPVAFYNEQGDVTLTQTCDPTTIDVLDTTVCEVTATNQSSGDSTVKLDSRVSRGLTIVDADGATIGDEGRTASADEVVLAGKLDAIPAIAQEIPGGGFLDLQQFPTITPIAVGDESAVNFDVPSFVFGGHEYRQIGITSNGYLVIGGALDASDIEFEPQTLPDPARPNGVLATYWTDLDGTGAEGIRAGVLGDGTNDWLVLQWDVHLVGDSSSAGARSMQAWIGVNGVEDITYEYAANTIGDNSPFGLTIGAENLSGTAGAQIAGPPLGTYRVTTTPGEPGGSANYTLVVRGDSRGLRRLTSTMTSDIVVGTTRVRTGITVAG